MSQEFAIHGMQAQALKKRAAMRAAGKLTKSKEARMSHATIGTRILHTLLAAIAGASLTACGGGGGGGSTSPPPPILSNLNYSPTDTAQSQSGTFAVQGTVNFADAGGDLKSLEVVVFDPSGKQVSDISTPVQGASGQTAGTIQGTVTVPTNTVGSFTFKIT